MTDLRSNQLPVARVTELAIDLVTKAGCEVFEHDHPWFTDRAGRGWTATEISRAFVRMNFAKGDAMRRKFLTALSKLGARV